MISSSDLWMYYQTLRLPPNVVEEVEQMRCEAPSRKVGVHALNNIKVDLYSRCNGARRKLESYTCEAAFALETELSRSAIAYWSQVGLKGIRRGSRTHVTTADFMVYDADGIRIVECKPQDALGRLAARKPDEWHMENGTWRRPPIEQWCAARGLKYEIWSPPRPHGIYLANLMVMYGAVVTKADEAEARKLDRVERMLEAGPVCLADARSETGLSFAAAACALANRRLFGTLRSRLLDDQEHFDLFPSNEHARMVDEGLLERTAMSYDMEPVNSRLLTASKTDYERGKLRLARVERMISGDEVVTKRYRGLVRKVLACRESGASPLEVCLTSYASSGCRVPRLNGMQEDELAKAVSAFQRSSSIRSRTQLHGILEGRCELRGCEAPSPTTLRQRIAKSSKGERALAVGGRRSYHAVKDPVDPIERTIDAGVPFLKVHVDSTKFDNRSLPSELRAELGPMCPTLYVAVDAATGLVLGRALLFGNACRDAFAVLIRDIVWRHGRLPKFWVADGGSEYTGAWFEEFCTATGASRIQPPSGAPRHNSPAENILGRVNSQVAKYLAGSTDPDKSGRRVDAKHKSYRTARLSFATLVKELDTFLFEDIPRTPTGLKLGTPRENYEDMHALAGDGGLAVKVDTDFLVQTSIPITRDIKVDPTKGIRHEGRTYSSSALFEAITSGQCPTEKRRDCVDPTKMYIRFARGWVSASSPDSSKIRAMAEVEQLFELMISKKIRTDARVQRNLVRDERFRRLALANASLPATSHLPTETRQGPPDMRPSSDWGDDTDLDPYTYAGE